MVLEAAADFDLDLSASWFIGDKSADVECGRRAGARTILVLSQPDFRAADVIEAIGIVLAA
jgi:D-glycero-D-manno-heptose 1,7-bisphosphate phosphatase